MIKRSLAALNLRRQNPDDNQKGFTLIELLVVVIIIGILAAIAIPVYLGVQASAKDAGVKSDLTNAKTAVIAYQTDGGALPVSTLLNSSNTTGLGKYGFTQGLNTSTLGYSGTPAAGAFCLVAPSASDSAKSLYVTDGGGVVGPTATKPLGC